MNQPGIELIEPTELYNLLNHCATYPRLSDANYVLLLDSRGKSDYDESHVITAKKGPRNSNSEYQVPYDAELECKQHVIVYDGKTSTLKEQGDGLSCAKAMWDMGSRNPVKLLRGGYEAFSALYPFLRTQKILYMPRELDELQTYPLEIVPGSVYIGNWTQANSPYIQKDLKVKAHVNCTENQETFFKEEGEHLIQVSVADTNDADLYSKFKSASEFIGQHTSAGRVVLVFSDLGVSRAAAVVMAYLMHTRKCSLQDAYAHVLKCAPSTRPNRGFVLQLSQWEEELLGEKQTDVNDPNY